VIDAPVNSQGVPLVTIAGNLSDGPVFQVDPGVTASIAGLTITGGYGPSNLAGGVDNYGTLAVTNSTIQGPNIGGGIYNAGTMTVTGSTIQNNRTPSGGMGGGIDNTGRLTVTNSTIANNSAGQDGGGIANTGTLTVTNSTIANNSAGQTGGGITNESGGTMTVTNSTIANNSVGQVGGGIANVGSLTVTNSTIANNSAGFGGGIAIANVGTLTVTNSTIANNSAGSSGGGIFNSAGRLTAVNTTIAYNWAGYGGGLYAGGGTATLDNTIVALNGTSDPSGFGGSSPSDIAGSVSSSSAYNLIGTGGSGGLTKGSNGNQVGVANPGLGRLGNNGGLTPTIALLNGSLAVDAGSNSLAVDPNTGSPLTTDQRGPGFPRIVNGTVDIGAFERPIVTSSPTVYTVTSTSGNPSVVGSLPYVINQANANPNLAGSEIAFDPTVFATPQTITLTSTLELSEPSAPEVINGPLDSQGANLVTISGNNAVRVVQVDQGVTASLSDLTISGGSATSGLISTAGGGVANVGHLSLTNVTVTANSAPGNGIGNAAVGSGGGIANAGVMTVTDCDITNNSVGSSGGGIYNVGVMVLDNSTIANNSATASGGGIYNSVTGALTITDHSTITKNNVSLYNGGGIDNAGGTMTIDHSTIANNIGAQYGAGISNVGTLTVTNSTITNNTNCLSGGGIDNESGGKMTVTYSTITSNSAVGIKSGGGVYNIGTLAVANSTIANNTAQYAGGGIFNDSTGTMTLANSTVAGNSVILHNGGGIENDGTMTAVNCTVAYNAISLGSLGGGLYAHEGVATLNNTIVALNLIGGALPSDIYVDTGGAVSGAYNLIGPGGFGGLSGVNHNIVVASIADLHLGALANNGGPTQTIALLNGSPAIDAGSNSLAVDPNTGSPLTTDQRGPGFPRIVNNTVDIGAYEVQATSAAPTVTAVTSSTPSGTYGVAATITITIGFSEAVIVTGTPQLALNSGGTANFSGGSGTSTLTFTYVVAAGQNGSRLDYTSTTALTLNGGSIADIANNAANLTLASPGAAGSLSANSNLVIDTVAPTVLSYNVLFGSVGKSYNLIGSTRLDLPWTITGIQVVFSKPIATGDLNSLTGLTTTAFAGLGTNTLTWSITSLTLGSFATALLGTGPNAIEDAAGNELYGGTGFAQSFKVLYGDFNGDGVVSAGDMAGVNSARFATYNIFADLSGDGVVDIKDVTVARKQVGTHL